MNDALRPYAMKLTRLLFLFLAAAVVAQAQTTADSGALFATGSAVSLPAAPSASALPVRRLASLRGAETGDGSRVTVTSDAALSDYSAYREGGRFYVVLPRASASFAPSSLPTEGRAYTDARFERRGEDVVLSFALRAGASARVAQSFNRLDIIFSLRQGGGTPPAPQPTPATQQTNGGAATSNTSATSDGANPAPPTVAPEQPKPADPQPAGQPVDASSVNTASPATGNAPQATTPIVFGAAARASLPPEKANPITVPRFDKPPVIDGKLDDEVWKAAAVFKDFYQIQPGDNTAPSKPTEVLLGYDAKNLYIAYRAYDERDKIRATIAKRDNIFNDDYVGLFFDTFNDKRKAYELNFNPLGIQADGVMTDGQGEDFTVDLVHDSKGEVNDQGYFVEVAIPFKSLRFVAGKDKMWGVHFYRRIKRFNNELSMWMPISRDQSNWLAQTGHITGLEGISTERVFELIPSLTVSESGRRVRTLSRAQLNTARFAGLSPTDPGKFVNQPIEFDPGLTAKFGITPTITLDAAINPDFAQVEADATVVTANQRFPIFFDEKRPFFLEGKDIFSTILSVVHTRTIVDPDVAVKVTGKQGKNSFGLMVASDNNPGDFTFEKKFDPEAVDPRIVDKNSYVGVFRLKRDVGKENTIGLLATGYSFIDKHNWMGGPDIRFRINKQTTFTGQVVGSISRRFFFYPDEASNFYRTENGMAYAFSLAREGRNWYMEVASAGRSRYFRADVGFNRRFNTNNPNAFIQYRATEKPKNTIVNWRVYNSTSANIDWRGRSQRIDQEGQFQIRFQRNIYVGVGEQLGFERVFEEEFGPSRRGMALITQQRFGNELAATLPVCDPTGTLAAPDPERPDTRIPRCTFFGEDDERSTRRKGVYAYIDAAPSKKYSFFIINFFNWGVTDFDFGTGNPNYPRVSPAALAFGQDAPLDPGAANEWFIESSAAYQPTNELRLSLSYIKSRYTRQDTDRVAFDDNIFTWRGTYQFTSFIFARARRLHNSGSQRTRPVPVRLDAEPRHVALHRLQRRHEPQRRQPLHRRPRAGLPSQRAHLLHQDVVPVPPQPVTLHQRHS
ncbi:MAG TPA: DUF5916 domain-containing protein [Pyrinomonadaceae bacterium]|nr:DUF5916 domain-containing protein [Pyrinomonadaceae bacterium]